MFGTLMTRIGKKTHPFSMFDLLNPKGKFRVEQFRGGRKVAERDFNNAVTTAGKTWLEDLFFGATAPTWKNTLWYFGLINNSPIPTLLTSDTLASHSGWSESAAYSGNRKAWTPSDASSGSKGTSSVSAFTMNATVSLYGAFLCSLATGNSPVNQVQSFGCSYTPTGGTFTAQVDDQITSGIAYNASNSTLQSALEALSNVGVGDLVCTGGPLPGTPIVATGALNLAGRRFPRIGVNGNLLTGGTPGTISVTDTTPGNPAILWSTGAFSDILPCNNADVVNVSYSISM